MKWLSLLFLLLLGTLCYGQPGARQIAYVTMAPSGACAATGIDLLTPNGTIYTCQSGVWAAISGGGGVCPSGSANAVQKTNGTNCAAAGITDDGTTVTSTEAINFSGSTHTRTIQTGVSNPATCTTGEVLVRTDATAGQNLYFCTSTNTWTQQLNSGSATGGGVSVYSGTAITVTAGTYYFPVGGGGSPSGTETNVDVDSSSAATITNFYVQQSVALGMGNTGVFTLRKNATSQSVTCTITGAVATSCSDTTHSFNVSQGDLLTVQLVTTGTIVVAPSITFMMQFGNITATGTVNTGAQDEIGVYSAAGAAISGGRCTMDSSQNILCTGSITTGSTSGVAGALKLKAGTATSIPANSFGWTAPTTMTTTVLLQSPNAVPAANQVMLFPAPTTNVSAFAWTTFSSTNLTDTANLIRNSTSCAGDLTGTMPTCTVAQVNGAVVPASAIPLVSNSSRQLVAATSGTLVLAVPEQVLGGTAAVVSFTSIPGTFRNLRIVMQGRCDTSATSDGVYVQFNADTGANYARQYIDGKSTTASAGQSTAGATNGFIGSVTCATGLANYPGTITVEIPNYSGTTFYKNGLAVQGAVVGAALTTNMDISSNSMWWANTAAITRIDIKPTTGGNFIAGSYFGLYAY